MAVTADKPAGTVAWPSPFSPQATTVPSLFNATVKWYPADIDFTPDKLAACAEDMPAKATRQVNPNILKILEIWDIVDEN
jgi:hypothetical protein